MRDRLFFLGGRLRAPPPVSVSAANAARVSRTETCGPQSIATIMHAFASTGQEHAALRERLTELLLRVPLRHVEARAAANIAWYPALNPQP